MLHIYKASAGSGKTFALTRHYLSLLLGERNPDTGHWRLRSAREDAHRHILAITFTNKATQEMTHRIISQLAILAHREPGIDPATDSPYLKYFTNLFNVDADTLSRTASDILDELLADFAYFHVSTIDAFFQNVLRIFAREVEMPDNFRLELDNSATISLGISEMFKSLNYGQPADPIRRRERQWLTDWLTRMMLRKFDKGETPNILARTSSLYNDLVDTFNQLLNEQFNLNSEKISAYLDRVELLSAFEHGISKMLSRAEADLIATSKALKQYGDYLKISHNIRPRIEDWATGYMKEPTATVIAAIDNPSKRYGSGKYIPSPEFDTMVALLCNQADKFVKTRFLHTTLFNAITPLGLLGCLLRHISTFCKDNNVILLSDTNNLLREIINDDETPFVYERLGYYLRHFLIDEVQDTSTLQWANLRPLIMESLGYDHENLVIGDEKQCIYRFRNSDPKLLGHIIADDVTGIYHDNAVTIEGNTIAQNNNWRSSRQVVTFNNSIFHAIALRYGVTDSYSNVIQQIDSNRKEIPGYVKLIFQPTDDTPTKKNSKKDSAKDSDEESSDKNSFSLLTLVAEVDRLLRAGYRPADIAILVRTHREGELAIERLLHAHDDSSWIHGPIEVKSTDAVTIGSSPAVKMIIEILRITQLPQQVTTLREHNKQTITETKENPARRRARLLYCYQYFLHTTVTSPDGSSHTPSPSEALSLALDAIRADEQGIPPPNTPTPPKASLRDILNFTAASTSGSDSTADDTKVTCLTLSAIVDKIISRYVVQDALPEETAYLTSFQDLVYDFCSQGSSDIRSFLAWWDNSGHKSSLSSTSESNAINVMTIHQSKGLEYPCVIIPFANSSMVKYSNNKRLTCNWMTLNPADFPDFAPEVVPPMIPVEFKSKLLDIPIFADQARKIIADQIVDNLNTCYVAFTRAVNELVIIAPASKKSSTDTEPTLDLMLREAVEYLTPDAIASDELLDEASRKWVLPLATICNGDIVEIGTPTSPSAEADDEKVSPDNIIDLPVYDPDVNDRLVTLTEADIDLFDFNNPRHRGRFLHNVLSKVRHPSDLSRALRRAAIRARLTSAQLDEAHQLLSEALANPEVQRWFNGYSRLYCEQSIATQGIDRRPDRIVILPDGSAEIIDYKFGEPEPAYISQVRRYISLLRKAGYPRVKGYLWFITSNTITEIH